MGRANGRLWARATVVALAVAAPVCAAAASDAEAPAVVQSLTTCRAIENRAERFACYDRVAGAIGKGEAAVNQAAGPPTPDARRENARRKFGKASGEADSRPAAAAKSPTFPEPIEQGVKRIAATLEHISRMSDGRLLIVTASDGAWLQTDHEPFQNLPRAGAEIILRQGRLGNYLCDLDRWHSVRCRRLD